MRRFSRREILELGLGAGSLAALDRGGLSVIHAAGKRDTRQKMIILGFDGLDANILESFMNQGKFPAFRRLRDEGGYRRLQTSLPPQSPVAWSNFITGMDPGGHGIFDFVHRTPSDYLPYLSTSRVEPPKRTFSVGDYVFPLAKARMDLLRQGKAFWQILEQHDVPATIVQIPANFPPAATKQRTLSGMGTPDILGSYGIFNFYTTELIEMKSDIGGGRMHLVNVAGNVVAAELPGPENTFRKEKNDTAIPFKVFVDPVNPVAKIVIQDQEFILREKEWSGWIRVRFPMIPTQSVPGMCRFYLKQVHPEFKLYVSPVNLDPARPALPISTPESYSRELEAAIGPFFTKGLPADTAALDNGVFDSDEFLEQDNSVLEETLKLFEYHLQRFQSGLWFHYFSSADQRQHMFMRHLDKAHPAYDPQAAAKYGSVIENIYREMDRIVARVLEKADRDTVVMIMSDHGFTPFTRGFNLNTWLLENGYLRLLDPMRQEEAELFANTDWGATKAYALGLNGLYINQTGREGKGIVAPGAEKEALVRELVRKLESVTDPATGERVISKAYLASESYHGPRVADAPEIIVGYNRGYRASWATPLGRMPKRLVEDNDANWSGDHCADPVFTPGILFTNRKVRAETPALYDLTATLLKVFEIEKPPEMIGQDIL